MASRSATLIGAAIEAKLGRRLTDAERFQVEEVAFNFYPKPALEFISKSRAETFSEIYFALKNGTIKHARRRIAIRPMDGHLKWTYHQLSSLLPDSFNDAELDVIAAIADRYKESQIRMALSAARNYKVKSAYYVRAILENREAERHTPTQPLPAWEALSKTKRGRKAVDELKKAWYTHLKQTASENRLNKAARAAQISIAGRFSGEIERSDSPSQKPHKHNGRGGTDRRGGGKTWK